VLRLPEGNRRSEGSELFALEYSWLLPALRVLRARRAANDTRCALAPAFSCAKGVAMIVKRLPYVPGFGGHRRRSECKCTIADELICGASHPDKKEAPADVERRKRSALVVSEREARISSWLADLFGTGAEREEGVLYLYDRPSTAKARAVPDRTDRAMDDSEWRAALAWMRKQPLRGELVKHRSEVASQFWLELRRPPRRESEPNLRKALERAKKRIRQEHGSSWTVPRPSLVGSDGRKQKTSSE
jgi:hypothetical protein